MKKFIQEHKVLFGSIILSLLMAIIFSALSILILFNDSTTLSDILDFTLGPLLPTVLIVLISFIATKTFTKHPKATKTITGIITTLILFLQFLIYFIVFYFGCALHEENYNKPQNYTKALHSIHKPVCIKHFPEKIPQNAKNIKMKKTENAWFGSEYIYLKFDIDKKYIEDELEKYKYRYKETIKANQGPPYPFRHHNLILSEMDIPYEKRKDFTFYIIHDYKSETPCQNSFLYYYGIAIDSSRNTIVYFYENPD